MGIDLAVTPIVSKRDGDPCASFTVVGGLVVPVVMAPCKDRTLVPVQATDVTTAFMSVADRTPLNCGGTDSENRVLLGCDHSSAYRNVISTLCGMWSATAARWSTRLCRWSARSSRDHGSPDGQESRTWPCLIYVRAFAERCPFGSASEVRQPERRAVPWEMRHRDPAVDVRMLTTRQFSASFLVMLPAGAARRRRRSQTCY
jgi:hypothetical protein